MFRRRWGNRGWSFNSRPLTGKRGSIRKWGNLPMIIKPAAATKWRSRRTKRPLPGFKISKKVKVLVFILVSMLLLLQSMLLLERHLKAPLMNLAKFRIKQIATQSINAAIADQVTREAHFDKLLDWKSDKNGKTTAFILNPAEQMRLTSGAIDTIQKKLDSIQNESDYIPLGMAIGSPIIASYGPNIPIKFVPMGTVKADILTRYQSAGINMVLVEVYMKIETQVTIIIPFDSEPETVTTELPIAYSLVVGDVPTYYFDNKGNPVGDNKGSVPPNISLPNLGASPSP
jgi:sporulation protein YunB